MQNFSHVNEFQLYLKRIWEITSKVILIKIYYHGQLFDLIFKFIKGEQKINEIQRLLRSKIKIYLNLNIYMDNARKYITGEQQDKMWKL
jgi:hypothetical protein